MTGMSRSDQQALIKIIHARAKQAKAAAAEREAILRNEIEEHLNTEFRLRQEVQADILAMAEEAIAKVNEQIAQSARLMGWSDRHVPRADLPYYGRFDNRSVEEADRARKLAGTRLAALRANANKVIEERALAIEESLIVGGLESDEARELVKSMPRTDELMPPLSLDDLGVGTWQPARDAAKELLTAPTGADRRRKLVRRAIAQNPGASDRKIAQITGFDHKTVAKYRDEEIPAIGGELAQNAGEFPGGDEEPS